jgi:TRAP-type C4-dicarboxylate transport system substrate-binding protein
LFASFDTDIAPDAIIVKEWAKELEEKSGGRVKVEYSWNSALGMMPQYYDLLTAGVCDMAVYLPMMRPGVGPMIEIAGLPWNHDSSASGTKAVYALYQGGYMDKEFADVKVCILRCANPTRFLSTKPIKSVADLQGLKVSGASDVMGSAFATVGVVSTPLPPMDLYPGLQKKVVDAGFGEVVMLESLKLIDVVNYITPGFGAIGMAYLMNKEFYNKLPADVQAIINELSLKYTERMAAYFDQESARVLDLFLKKGGQVDQFGEADLAVFDKNFVPFWNKYIADWEAKGVPMKKAIDLFWNTLKENGVAMPAVGYTPAGG